MKFNVLKNKYELNKYFEIRKKIIDFYNPKNKKDFIYINNLSHIYINIKFNYCKYNIKTEKIINNIVSQMNNTIKKNKIIENNSFSKLNNKVKTNKVKKVLKLKNK
jgi:hypothetical protein